MCFDDQQRQSEKKNLFLGFVFVPQMHRRCAAAAACCSCSPALPLIHLEPQPHDPHNEEASDPDGDRLHFTCLCYAITFRSPCRRFETSAAPPDPRRFLFPPPPLPFQLRLCPCVSLIAQTLSVRAALIKENLPPLLHLLYLPVL